MTLRERLLNNPLLEYQNNLFYQKDPSVVNQFEETYRKLRERENRIHVDDVVKKLPEIHRDHPNEKEWWMRKSTLEKLIRFLSASRALNILELGCGNGWLSHNLATALKVDVCGVDINEVELLQGGRVFNNQQNLSLVYANIFDNTLRSIKFDTVILGSSIQYFPNLKKLFATLFDLLNTGGTIYIIDSPLYYTRAESEAAKSRSRTYFDSIGSPEMTGQYFHHTFAELSTFNYKILYNPKALKSLVMRKIFHLPLSVFPIISIKKTM